MSKIFEEYHFKKNIIADYDQMHLAVVDEELFDAAIKEVQSAYRDYIKFLSNYISSTSVFLAVHGITPSEEQWAEGEKLRKVIEELEHRL
jgi:hypothetical protein